MRKILFGALVALASVLIYRSCADDRSGKRILQENSMLLQEQLKNVSKLVVTEGHFAEVYTYKDSKELFGPMWTADKKALVVVNAQVSIQYDLGQLEYDVDGANKTLFLKHIPEPEVKINPDFEYYDVKADYFNPFKADDYNAIKTRVKASLLKKVEASSLKTNAENRLLTELSKILVLTNSMGWTLVYDGRPMQSFDGFFLN